MEKRLCLSGLVLEASATLPIARTVICAERSKRFRTSWYGVNLFVELVLTERLRLLRTVRDMVARLMGTLQRLKQHFVLLLCRLQLDLGSKRHSLK